MAFKSEDSGKWKVFMILAATPPEERIGVETIAARTGVTLGTVETYLKDFCRILPTHIGYIGKPPLYSFRAEGKTVDEIYKQVKEYYNKRSRESRKVRKDPPEQKDFVRGRPPSDLSLTLPPPPFEERNTKINVEEKPTLVMHVPVTELNDIRSLAMKILNPIVAFRFDQVELYHNVIREQQRHAEGILEILNPKFVNE